MKTAIYVSAPLRNALAVVGALESGDAAGSRSGRINTIAERYIVMIVDAMPAFTRAEWLAIFNANGRITGDIHSVMYAWAPLLESEDQEDGVDRKALAERLRALPVSARIAIGEANERFWTAQLAGTADAADALTLCGARVTEEIKAPSPTGEQ